MKLIPLLMALVIAGCATAPAIDPSTLPSAPVSFKEGDGRWTLAAPAAAQPRGEWWKAFNDPVLDDLVERANRSNASIQVAAGRLAQARALVGAADADRLPQLGVGASAFRLDGIVNGTSGPPRTIGLAAGTLAYEVDLAARARQRRRAPRRPCARGIAAEHAPASAEVAQTYSFRALDDERGEKHGGAYCDAGPPRGASRGESPSGRRAAPRSPRPSPTDALDRRRAELDTRWPCSWVKWPGFAVPWRMDTAPPVIPAGVPSTCSRAV